jgi:hypothetical protein
MAGWTPFSSGGSRLTKQRFSDSAPVLLAAGLLVVVSAVGVALVKWLDVELSAAAGLAALVIVGLGLVVVLLAAISGAYESSTASRQDAFGLPDGSIRALIALAVLLAFTALVVYILTSVLSDGAERDAAAQQVIGILGTLVAAIAAFYFGTNSVKTGAAAIASLTGPPGELKPEAITKGTA